MVSITITDGALPVPASLTFPCPCECHGSSRPCNIEGGCGHLHPGCGVCSAPVGDTGRLCRTHTDGLRIDLADVPDLVAELEITRTRQNRTSAEKHGARSTTRPLPWNEHTAQKAFELNATLNAWALDVSKLGEDERDRLAPVHHTDTAEVARWIARNLSTLRMHAEAGTAHEEITDAIHQARRSIDKPQDQVTYGPCKNELDSGVLCEEFLYSAPGRHTVTCRGCGAIHNTEARKEWMMGHVTQLVGTAAEAAGYLRLAGVEVSASTVRNLAARKRFLPVDLNDQKRPCYRVSEVLLAVSNKYKRGEVAS